jgi:hypothetical protein
MSTGDATTAVNNARELAFTASRTASRTSSRVSTPLWCYEARLLRPAAVGTTVQAVAGQAREPDPHDDAPFR